MKFKDLVGMIFTKIDINKDKTEMIFNTEDQRKFLLYHYQD